MKRLFAISAIVLVICGLVRAAADSWSLDFEKDNVQYISDSVAGFDTTQRSMSAACWVKMKSAATMGFCGTDYFNQDMYWYYDNTNHNMLYARGNGSTSTSATSSSWTPNIGEWYHVAVTHDQTTARFYVNGSELSNTSLSGGSLINSAPYFFVGGIYANWASAPKVWIPFDGEIAGMIITSGDAGSPNAVLSAANISTLYNSGTIDTASWSSMSIIRRLYTMEEGTGTTTTNGNGAGTATLSGTSGTPTWTAIGAAGENVLILVQ